MPDPAPFSEFKSFLRKNYMCLKGWDEVHYYPLRHLIPFPPPVKFLWTLSSLCTASLFRFYTLGFRELMPGPHLWGIFPFPRQLQLSLTFIIHIALPLVCLYV